MRRLSRVLLWGSALSLALVIYLSLLPFQFRPVDLNQAWSIFRWQLAQPSILCSRSDFIANVLLMAPAAFFLMGLAIHGRQRSCCHSIITSAVVCAALTIVSFAVEWGQVWCVGRTPSPFDVLAQVIGIFAGVAGWWLCGELAITWIAEGIDPQLSPGSLRPLWFGYVGLLAVYSLLPLDITISPAQLIHKFREGYIVWRPVWPTTIAALGDDGLALLTESLHAAPLGLLSGLVPGRKRTGLRATLPGLTVITGLEWMQIFVAGRTASISDWSALAIGVVAGQGLACYLRRNRGATIPSRTRVRWGHWLVVAGWSAAVVASHCEPIRVTTDRQVWWKKSQQLLLDWPLATVEGGHPLWSMQHLVKKILEFAPLGGLFYVALDGDRPGRSRFTILAILIGLIAVGIELLQIPCVGHHPNSGDAIVCTAAGLCGLISCSGVIRARST